LDVGTKNKGYLKLRVIALKIETNFNLKLKNTTETGTASIFETKKNPNQTRTDPFKNVRNWNQNIPLELGKPANTDTHLLSYLPHLPLMVPWFTIH
jgi:hypothetical protein